MPRAGLGIALLVICGASASCAKVAPAARPTVPQTASSPQFGGIIPRPRVVEPAASGGFAITSETAIVVSPNDERALWVAHYLADVIGIAASLQPPRVEVVSDKVVPGAITLVAGDESIAGPEAYELAVTPNGVTIRAGQAAGLFYGVQSFRQLLPAFVEYQAVRPATSRPVVAEAGRVADAPRYGWRGAMLDVSRHFFAVADVKRYIDLMTLYKLNRLHLHLSDDQGWRIEIASWPRLATHGGSTQVGGGRGGFYTQAEYRELVTYAADRFVTIVPEIDLPGHTNAALASYAELNCDGVARELYTGTDVGFSALCVDAPITYRFIDDVVRELAALTPGPWLHIGGDEVKTLTPDQYARFVERVQDIVEAHGKRPIGWDEITSAAVRPTSVVQVWRPKEVPAAAVAAGVKVIVSTASRSYLDMKYDNATALGLTWAGLIDVDTAYTWDPATLMAGVPESAILGIETPLWSETAATIRDVEYLAFPRLAALAEVAWSRAEDRNWDDFKARLGGHGPRLTALGVNFYRSPHVPWKH